MLYLSNTHTHDILSGHLIGCDMWYQEAQQALPQTGEGAEDQAAGSGHLSVLTAADRRTGQLDRQAFGWQKLSSVMTEQCVNQQTSQEDARKSTRGSAKQEERDYQWVCDCKQDLKEDVFLVKQFPLCCSSNGCSFGMLASAVW